MMILSSMGQTTLCSASISQGRIIKASCEQKPCISYLSNQDIRNLYRNKQPKTRNIAETINPKSHHKKSKHLILEFVKPGIIWHFF